MTLNKAFVYTVDVMSFWADVFAMMAGAELSVMIIALAFLPVVGQIGECAYRSSTRATPQKGLAALSHD